MSPATALAPICPKCEGKMWDNRLTKKNPKAPDWKCRDKGCDGCIWPERGPAPTVVTNNIAETARAAAVKTLDLIDYGDPLPGKHDGGVSKLQPQGTGSHRGNPDWMDELFHVYAACWPEAAQYSTDPIVQANICATLFIAAVKAKP